MIVQKFKNYSVDEGLKLRPTDILLGLAILGNLIIYGYKISNNDIEDVRKLYHMGSTNEYNHIKKSLISSIRSSSRIDESIKELVIDSLESVKIIKIDMSRIKFMENNELNGCFISIDLDSNINNLIIVSDLLTDDEISPVIIHELYHYVDNLMGENGKSWSQLNELKNIVNLKYLSDSQTFKKRVAEINDLMFVSRNSSDIKHKEELTTDVVNGIWPKKDYYYSEKEIFVRFQNLKMWLVKNCHLKSMDDCITKESLSHIFLEIKDIRHQDFFCLIYIIDLEKIDLMNTTP